MKIDFTQDEDIQNLMDCAWSQSETLEELGGTDELIAIAAACKRILVRRIRCKEQLATFASMCKRGG